MAAEQDKFTADSQKAESLANRGEASPFAERRYFLELAYNGGAYCGWQVQLEKPTVQLVIMRAISQLLNRQTKVQGCGRTDAGVHASQFFLHFDGPLQLPDEFAYRLNKMMPKDINIIRLLEDIPHDAHARFDATKRAYDYFIHFNKDPFHYPLSCFFPWLPLDFERMHEAASLLLEYNDFPMFCKTGGANKTTLCDMFESQIFLDEKNGTMRYRVAANRFLRGMVRRIVGSLINVGKYKISVEEYKEVLETKGSFKYNLSAPPEGLFLSEVHYPYIIR